MTLSMREFGLSGTGAYACRRGTIAVKRQNRPEAVLSGLCSVVSVKSPQPDHHLPSSAVLTSTEITRDYRHLAVQHRQHVTVGNHIIQRREYVFCLPLSVILATGTFGFGASICATPPRSHRRPGHIHAGYRRRSQPACRVPPGSGNQRRTKHRLKHPPDLAPARRGTI